MALFKKKKHKDIALVGIPPAPSPLSKPELPPLPPAPQEKPTLKKPSQQELPPLPELPPLTKEPRKEKPLPSLPELPPLTEKHPLFGKGHRIGPIPTFPKISPAPKRLLVKGIKREPFPTLPKLTPSPTVSELPPLPKLEPLKPFTKTEAKKPLIPGHKTLRHIPRPIPLEPLEESAVEYHRYLDMKPLFVKSDDYKEIMKDIKGIKSKINESENILVNLNEIKAQKDKEFSKIHKQIEDIQRKLIYIDKTVFKG